MGKCAAHLVSEILEHGRRVALVEIVPIRFVGFGHARVEAFGMEIGDLDIMAALGQAGDELVQDRAAKGMSPRMVENHKRPSFVTVAAGCTPGLHSMTRSASVGL